MGNSPVSGEFPAQRPVTRSFKSFFYLHLNKRLSKQSQVWWFETQSRSLWRQCNVYMCFVSVSNTFIYINSSSPSAAYMRRWPGSALAQAMACRLFGARSMLTCFQLDPKEQTSVKFESKYKMFYSRKCIWKCRLPKWRPFCQGGDELKCASSASPPFVLYRADSRFAPSQWETSLQSNAVSHWLSANLETA